jgi:broad specificity phosphatase PhoE
MKIILIRHAESELNAIGKLQSQKYDSRLSAKGKEQAKKLAERLKNEKIEAIYSSDMKRAAETASEIAKMHGLKVHLDKRLREFDSGDLVDKEDKWEYWKKYREEESKRLVIKPEEVNTPGGESEKDHLLRVEEFLEEIKKKYSGTVVIVGHAGTNKVFFRAAGLVDKDKMYEIKQNNAAISIIKIKNGKAEIHQMNDLKHLE